MGETMTKLKLMAAAAVVLAAALPAAAAAHNARAAANLHDAVYTLTNSAAGNGVAAFARGHDGSLTYVGTTPTGGLGTGANLGSQGSVAVSKDGTRIYAVNAASNTISELKVDRNALSLVTTVSANGVQPISLTLDGNRLYVLDAGSATITGFTLHGHAIVALPGSTQPLLGSGPAQVSFSPHRDQLVVTEKASGTLDVYPVDAHGRALPGTSTPSAGATPFGFAFDNKGRAYVSEAGGTASSYNVDNAGAHVISGAVQTFQGAPCWLVVTPNGRYAYTANAGSATISGFAIGRDGSLSLLDPTGVTASLGAGAHPLDEAVSKDGRFFYVLVDGRHTVAGFRIAKDGSLKPLGEVGTLPAGTVGLATS
jgi:6-phosphogluconolactonase